MGALAFWGNADSEPFRGTGILACVELHTLMHPAGMAQESSTGWFEFIGRRAYSLLVHH